MNTSTKVGKQNITSLVLVLLLLFTIALFSMACEPKTDITFQNQQNQDIKIFVAHVRDDGSIDGFGDYGTILAKTTKTMTIAFLGDEWVNRIKAVGPSGNEVFSHDYSRKDLEKISWKIVIPPS